MQRKAQLIAVRLTEKGAETLTFFRSLTPDDLEAEVYAEGKRWTARDILCHFVSAERALLQLFQNIVAGGEGVPEDFDMDRFNNNQVAKMGSLEFDDLLVQFEQARAAMIAFVESLSDSDLNAQGRHPWFGAERLEKFLKLVYRHNMLHQRDIKQALASIGSGS